MQTAQNGDVVIVNYVGTLDDGTVFDQTDASNPVSFVLGSDTILPYINQAFIGMRVGEEKRIDIPPEDAFGWPDDKNIRKLSRLYLKEEEHPVVGEVVRLKMEKGIGEEYGTITSFDTTHIVVDLNHPLAGQTLHYTLKVIQLLKRSSDTEEKA